MLTKPGGQWGQVFLKRTVRTSAFRWPSFPALSWPGAAGAAGAAFISTLSDRLHTNARLSLLRAASRDSERGSQGQPHPSAIPPSRGLPRLRRAFSSQPGKEGAAPSQGHPAQCKEVSRLESRSWSREGERSLRFKSQPCQQLRV